MRKYILIVLLIFITIIGCFIVGIGAKLGPLKIYSYHQISSASNERKKLLVELNEKNTTEYVQTKKAILLAAEKYIVKKDEYDTLVENGELTEESELYNSNLYDLDFLYTRIGNYATQNGIVLQIDPYTSSSLSAEYVICNLNFTITGDYAQITNFIYNIEDDDTLKFEINNFVLEKGGENLQGTFVVKNIPINRKNLSAIPTTYTTSINTKN